MNQNEAVLGWLVAEIVANGTRSWPIEKLYQKFGKDSIDHLIDNEFLLGARHLRVSKEGAYYVLVGGLPARGPSPDQLAHGKLVSHLDLRDLLIAHGVKPSTAEKGARSTFRQLLQEVHSLEFVCTRCWQSRGVCRHSRGTIWDPIGSWQITARSILSLAEADLIRVSPIAKERTLSLRAYLKSSEGR